jgi:hypothetical protein
MVRVNSTQLSSVHKSTVPKQQALMSFEEERLDEAMKALQETEKRCDVSNLFKFRKSKKKFAPVRPLCDDYLHAVTFACNTSIVIECQPFRGEVHLPSHRSRCSARSSCPYIHPTRFSWLCQRGVAVEEGMEIL